MQWLALKILIILFALFFSTPKKALAQLSDFRLKTADSLFNARQYTQSLEHYEVILESKQYSPAMLLKMAFIHEGLKRPGEALYYLNLYYLATQDQAALDKMEQLSARNRLNGYQNTDIAKALTFYRQHHHKISFAIMALLFFLFCLAVFVKRKKHSVVPVVITLLIFCTLFGVHIYAGEPSSKGIVARANTYLMEGPSGGASVKAIVQAGHRVEIKGKHDVWLEIEWQGEPAFIKEDLLLPVAL